MIMAMVLLVRRLTKRPDFFGFMLIPITVCATFIIRF